MDKAESNFRVAGCVCGYAACCLPDHCSHDYAFLRDHYLYISLQTINTNLWARGFTNALNLFSFFKS